jgi:hypothetical protein
MLYTCYLRDGVVYVPTVGKRGGVYTTIAPVAAVPVANTEGLRRAFLDAITRRNVAVPPVKGKWPPPLLPKYAGVKSWSAFARGALTWNIIANEELYQIVGHRLHEDGYWVEDHDQRIKFPAGTTVGDVIDRMIAIMQDAVRNQSH